MRRFVVSVLGNAIALWLVVSLVSAISGSETEVGVVPYADGTAATVLTYLFVALVFGVVNSVLGTAIRIVAFPLYLVTLGLVSLLVNGLLFLLVAWLTSLLGFGLVVGGFWWGVLGALLLGVIGSFIGVVLRPLSGPTNR